MDQRLIKELMTEVAHGFDAARSHPPEHPEFKKAVANAIAVLERIFSVSGEFSMFIDGREIIVEDVRLGVDTDQSVRNQLLYNLSPTFGFVLVTELVGSSHEDRSPTGNSLREDVNTSNALTLHAEKESVAGWTRIKLDWGAQEDITGLKHSRGTSLESGISWFPGQKDSISLTTGVRKKQYDTSDETNYDDRDRLRRRVFVKTHQ